MFGKIATASVYLLFLAFCLELFAYISVEFLLYEKLQTIRPLYRQRDIYNGKVDDQAWGVWGRPGYRGTIRRSCFEVHYAFNSVGARDKERSRRNESGAPRSIVLGDSFIEGYGVEPEDRLSDTLERTTDREYLNFSSAFDFGPLQYWLLYERLAKHYDHDQVIIGFLPNNDFTDNDPRSNEWKASERFRPYWRLTEDRHDFTVVYKGLHNKGHGYPPTFRSLDVDRQLSYLVNCSYFLGLVRRVLLSIRYRLTRSYNGYFEHDADRLVATELIFKKLAASIGNRKKVVLIIPGYEEVIEMKRKGSLGGTEFNEFLARLERMGYVVINLLTYQVALSEKQNQALYMRPCDGHWSRTGSEYVANILLKELSR